MNNAGTTPNRLLIVDDEPGITRLIEAAAKEAGFQVQSIHDSALFEQALQAIQPTIVILDVNMPGRGGLELITHLAKINHTAKVVVMSGFDPRYVQMSSDVGSARGVTIAGTLSKPFRRQQLLDLLISLA